MKFFTPIVVLSATVAVEAQMNALPRSAHNKRDVGPLKVVMDQVLEGMAGLQQVSTNYAGGAGGDIKSGIESTLVTVKSATSECKKMGSITMSEADGFRPTAEKLTTAGDKLVVTLTSKVPLFEKNHICGPVLGWFGGLGENVGVLMQTVAAKFPSNGSATEIAAFKSKFADLGAKLDACSGNRTESSATGATKPSTAEVTNKPDTVSHSGAGSMGVSAGVLALAAAAAILL
ncbi:cell wall protein [Apiospora rasikravindrae]|uniref:Cell wall protein n=1 Tax=Apiospora rasikravindrae TaxID=990691 RepID=A0ABR1TX15_9PEZI